MVNAIGRTTVPRLNKPIANLSLFVKIINDNADNLDDRRAWAFFASKLAPTVQRTIEINCGSSLACDGAVSASICGAEKPLSPASQLPQRICGVRIFPTAVSGCRSELH